jgi:hypothetical protein
MMIELSVGVGEGGAMVGSTVDFGHAGRVEVGVGDAVGTGVGVKVPDEVGVGVALGLEVGATGAEVEVAVGLLVGVACEL